MSRKETSVYFSLVNHLHREEDGESRRRRHNCAEATDRSLKPKADGTTSIIAYRQVQVHRTPTPVNEDVTDISQTYSKFFQCRSFVARGIILPDRKCSIQAD